MKNTIVVKNLTLRMVLANKEVSEILQKNLEITKEQANSVAKVIVDKMDFIVRNDENPKDMLTELLAR